MSGAKSWVTSGLRYVSVAEPCQIDFSNLVHSAQNPTVCCPNPVPFPIVKAADQHDAQICAPQLCA